MSGGRERIHQPTPHGGVRRRMKLWYLGDVTPVFLEPALRYLFVLVASLAVLPASAILIRPDRDDAEYLEMATRYLSAVRLEPVDAEGVLIAPRWILTDAGNAQQLEDMKPRPRLRIGKGEHEIQAIYFSDHWVLGLVLLKSAVAGVVSTPLYRADDEAGKTVIMVSHGATGMIGGSATSRDNRARAAINTVPSVTSRYFGRHIMPPEEASDLQGAATYTDRGSPAYIETKEDRKSTRLNSSHQIISYAVFCLKKKKQLKQHTPRVHQR